MPGSDVTLSSVASSSFAKKYRTKSKESIIDETLFSRPSKPKLEEPQFVANKNAPLLSRVDVIKSKPRKPDAVRIITKDLIRKLVIPSGDPSGETVILDGPKYSQILKSSEVKSKEQLQSDHELLQMQKEALALQAQKRKDELNRRDLHRMHNEKPSDIQLEEKQKAQYLLEGAIAKRFEQEDEIKHLNELCLNARCHAIRDAQMLEKKVIRKEEKEEEKRLDNLMEADRVKAIRLQEQMEEMRRQARYAGADQVMKQIEKKAQDKLLALEKKDQECQHMLKYLEKLQREDIETMDIKRVKQKKLRKEIDKIHQEYLDQQEHRKEQDRMADKRVLEFTRQKEEREAELEREHERIRREKEKEIARLRDQQERLFDVKAEHDALRAKRHYEETEREWRRKEEEAAKKKAQVNQMMQKARTEQINAKHNLMAVESQRERNEFERVLQEQRRLVEKDRLAEEGSRNTRLKYADAVRKQIIDKETVKLAERKAFFQEGVKLEEEARQRKARLEEVKNKKLELLRKAGVPDKYCKEVERRIRNPAKHICA